VIAQKVELLPRSTFAVTSIGLSPSSHSPAVTQDFENLGEFHFAISSPALTSVLKTLA
jgi:hypothetical protein